MSLNNSQIKQLRAEAHRLKLKPVVTIGQNGLSEAVQQEISIAVAHHELLKIRLPALEKPAKKQLIDSICKRHQAELVQAIGGVIVVYRCNQEKNRYASILAG